MPGGGAVGSVRATVRGRLDAEEHRRLVRRAEAVFAAAGVAHATVQIEGDACVAAETWRAGKGRWRAWGSSRVHVARDARRCLLEVSQI